MPIVALAILLIVGLCLVTLLVLEIGRRYGGRRQAIDPQGAAAGSGVVNGAVFGLLGLLIAFTFSGAASRFDTRRQLIVQEANAIGTAYLRLDLLPAAAQPQLREKFRRYVDARLAFYGKLPDIEAAKVEIDRYTALQGEIWNQAVAGCQQSASPPVMSLVLAALNEMIDITTTRAMSLRTHPPAIIFVMLVVMVLASALLAGYEMAGSKQRPWLHMLGFALLMSLVIYVIADLEFPRIGLVQISAADQLLVDLRNSMR